MRKAQSSVLSKSRNALRYLFVSATVVYGFVLCAPQVLFAYEISHDAFKVYSQGPIDPNIHAILDDVEGKLSASGINDKDLKPRIFLFDSHRHYAWLSLYIDSNSFAKCYPALPTNNIFVNKSDVARDLVFRDAETNRSRGLGEVLAHEVTHLLVREKFGFFTNLTLPAWKKEGYSEYVAGGTLLDPETGARMWREHPADDTGYRYFKYYMLVSYLLDRTKLSVEEMFTRDFDRPTLEGAVLDGL